jgi:hypothetical protein
MNLEELRDKVVKRQKETLDFIERNRESYGPIVEEVSLLDPYDMRIDSTSLDINIVGDKQVLNRVFGILRRHGYEPLERPTENTASYMTWFSKEGCGGIWLNFSSTQCRRVKVGTKMVEQDVYDVVCNDDAPAEAAPVEQAEAV